MQVAVEAVVIQVLVLTQGQVVREVEVLLEQQVTEQQVQPILAVVGVVLVMQD
tara:strand:+ start:148 stop:306 length:159 start_codon:yes stop_codon:yes gene_type:complete